MLSSLYIRDLNLPPIRFVQFVPQFIPRCRLYSFIISMTECLNSLNMATFYVRFRSCFLLFARFFVAFSVFLIYFYCFLTISICFPTNFMTFILRNPRNSMTSAKSSNVQTKPNRHIMADDFRTLNCNRSGTITSVF